MAKQTEKCKNCRYWKNTRDKLKNDIGECRRFPTPGGYQNRCIMDSEDWCGEWAKK